MSCPIPMTSQPDWLTGGIYFSHFKIPPCITGTRAHDAVIRTRSGYESPRDDTSDSDESACSSVSQNLTLRDGPSSTKSKTGEICDVCHLAYEPSYIDGHYLDNPWEAFSSIRSSALAGRRCCSLIIDAIETWLRHVDHRAYNAVHTGSGLLFDTLEVRPVLQISRKERDNNRYITNPLVYLYWGESRKGVPPIILSIFAPHGM